MSRPTPNQSGEQSELAEIIGSIRTMIGNELYHQEGSLEVIKTMIQQREKRLIRRREAEAVREALEVIWRKSVAVYPPDPQAQYEQLTGINKYAAEQLHLLTHKEEA